ncbi:MAG: transcriptional repressor LexA [Candidatus Obscuribacterales bacterium]|nr:transcriptional repressor LexA [Candidatus Obscuribacterales bacterium]
MVDLDILPPRQREVVRQIIQLTDEHGYPPTLAELAKALGLRNRMTVHQHVVALKKKGIVRWEPGLNRSLRIVGSVDAEIGPDADANGKLIAVDDIVDEEDEKPKGIPLAGTIAAGRPIDAVGTDDYLEIENQYLDNGCFALKVKGDSMIDDGICDGDFVIIKPRPNPNNGEIVVATLEDGTTTLKRFFKEKNRFRLQPANSEMEPIFINSMNDMQVQGVVVALYRKM